MKLRVFNPQLSQPISSLSPLRFSLLSDMYFTPAFSFHATRMKTRRENPSTAYALSPVRFYFVSRQLPLYPLVSISRSSKR
jgi:hypothetical protein